MEVFYSITRLLRLFRQTIHRYELTLSFMESNILFSIGQGYNTQAQLIGLLRSESSYISLIIKRLIDFKMIEKKNLLWTRDPPNYISQTAEPSIVKGISKLFLRSQGR